MVYLLVRALLLAGEDLLCIYLSIYLQLVKHFTGLQSLLSTLGQVYKEIGLLMVLICVCVLTLSSLVYFAEKGGVRDWSFYQSFWWGLMCITTVGQGSNNPDTAVGRVSQDRQTHLHIHRNYILATLHSDTTTTFLSRYF